VTSRPLLRAAGARNICVRFADVTLASGLNLAHSVTHKICMRCASCSPRTSCKCCAHLPHNKGCYFWTPFSFNQKLNPSYTLKTVWLSRHWVVSSSSSPSVTTSSSNPLRFVRIVKSFEGTIYTHGPSFGHLVHAARFNIHIGPSPGYANYGPYRLAKTFAVRWNCGVTGPPLQPC
jgi:hypothetical protein